MALNISLDTDYKQVYILWVRKWKTSFKTSAANTNKNDKRDLKSNEMEFAKTKNYKNKNWK